MLIRNAVEQDFKGFLDLADNAYYSVQKNGFPALQSIKISCTKMLAKNDKDFQNIFNKMVEDEKIIILEEEGILLAYALVAKERKTWKILDFVVKKIERGKGIGTQLVTQIIKDSKKSRVTTIELVCDFSGAQEFWKRMGFKEIRQGIFQKIL